MFASGIGTKDNIAAAAVLAETIITAGMLTIVTSCSRPAAGVRSHYGLSRKY